jgi:serine protease AprX
MRRSRVLYGVAVGLGVLAGGVAVAPAAQASPMLGRGALAQVIVGYDDGDGAREAVAAAGGSVRRQLGLVDSFLADVPTDRLNALATAPGVRSVTPDGKVTMSGKSWLADATNTTISSVTKMTGAQDVWKNNDAKGQKITGKGVGVAVIDSGIAPAKGLAGTGKVVNGPDLSLESQAPNLRNLDTFGHGTHMAGIIAGRDPEVAAGKEDADPTQFVGIAPDATLLNMKVAATDGAVDVSQVIAAIDWVVVHRNDPGLNIRVINLSFGTDSTQDPRLDPLSHAVEAAWRNGIVVVVAVGNDGTAATRVSMPAANPYVIAVGAADHKGTESKLDDVVADFTTRGNATRHADLVAPGRSIISLRTPNSFLDTNYPTGRLATTVDATQRYFKGSGTSQATAVVSGAAALLLQQRPTLTPDQVKKLLMTGADPMPAGDPLSRGAGQLNIRLAAALPTPLATLAQQKFTASTGLGTLEGARGTAHVVDPDTGVELTGERDIMGEAWNATKWAAACTTGTAWSTTGTWNGRTWSGSGWASGTWTGANWTSRTWSSRTWSGATWNGTTWTSRTWSSRTWSGRTWSGGYWSGSRWG